MRAVSGSSTRIAFLKEEAVRQGYQFINIKLLRRSFRGVQGAHILRVRERYNHTSSSLSCVFSVGGGPLSFIRDDMRGGEYCAVVDTDHNRAFLRSQFKEKPKDRFFDFVDPHVGAEIMEGKSAPALPGEAVGAGVDPSAEADYKAKIAELERIVALRDEQVTRQAGVIASTSDKLRELNEARAAAIAAAAGTNPNPDTAPNPGDNAGGGEGAGGENLNPTSNPAIGSGAAVTTPTAPATARRVSARAATPNPLVASGAK